MPPVAKGVTNERQQVYHSQFKKTVICRFYLADACKKGSKCTFAHSVEELQDVPDLRKTALCKHWKRGLCTLSAESCPFAHAKRELRMSPAFAQITRTKQAIARSPLSSVSTRSPESTDGSQSSPSPQTSPRVLEHGQTPPAPSNDTSSPVLVDLGVDFAKTKKRQQSPASKPAEPLLTLAELTRSIAKAQPENTMSQHWGPVGGAVPQRPPALKEAEPVFVEVPQLTTSWGTSPTAASQECYQSRSRLVVDPPVLTREPAFIGIQAAPSEAGPIRAEGKSRLMLSEWLVPQAEPGQEPTLEAVQANPAPSGNASSASEGQPFAIRQHAAELRAIASAAEQKAAAFAQEAALLRSRAETAERELKLAMGTRFDGAPPRLPPRPVELASLLDAGLGQ